MKVNAVGPCVFVTSMEMLRPRSAASGIGTLNRVRPAASVSSVRGVGPKNPVPAETRPLQSPRRRRAETLGLKNVPYSLCTSSLPLNESDSQRVTSRSSWAKTPGVVNV